MRCHWHQVILWLRIRFSVTHDALCEYNGQTGIKEINFTKLDVTYIIRAIGNTSFKCQIPWRNLEERIDQMYKCTCLTEIVFFPIKGRCSMSATPLYQEAFQQIQPL